MARATAEENASRHAAAKEKQLSEMRRARRDADDAHQAMLNRISFLRSEEAKLDRDIEAAKRRALELLSRKAEKAEKQQDSELVATAKDILEAVGPSVPTGKGTMRPNTGRSSLRSSIAMVLSTAPMSATAHPSGLLSGGALTNMPTAGAGPRSASAQRSSRALAAGQPLKPTKPSLSSPTPLAAKRPPAAPSRDGTASPSAAAAAAAASTSGRPPLPMGTPTKPGSRPGSREAEVERTSAKRLPASPAKGLTTAAAAVAAAAGRGVEEEKVPALPLPGRGAAGEAGMQQLDAGNGAEAAAHLLRQTSQQQGAKLNRMDTLGSSGRAAVEETDPELIEELIAGTASASAPSANPQLQGLQQFSSEGATRVVHVKSTAKAKPRDSDAAVGGSGGSSAVVLSSGVGWGLSNPALGGSEGGTGPHVGGVGPSVVVVDAAEQARLQQELAKKRKLRGVRKAFGLQPTPLQDSSAQVEELGAGSWQ